MIRIVLPKEAIYDLMITKTHNKKVRYEREISDTKVKATIAHELSHWVRDTNSNFYLTKLQDLNDKELFLLRQNDVDLTHFEIDAQVHAIRNVKRQVSYMWDTISFVDLAYEYTSLYYISKKLISNHREIVFKTWMKRLLKRLDREGLLGKTMINGMNKENVSKMIML